MRRQALAGAAALLAIGVTLTGCGQSPSTAGGKPKVVAGMYPLQYLAEQVGGERIELTPLANTGVEPHDLEITPQHVLKIADANLVLHVPEFQPRLDEAITNNDVRGFDALAASQTEFQSEVTTTASALPQPKAQLLIPLPQPALAASQSPTPQSPTPLPADALTNPPVSNQPPRHDHEAEGDAGQQGGHQEGDYTDPHFWLDPMRYTAAAKKLADTLAELDPAGTDYYRQRAAAFGTAMTALDIEYRTGLATCRSRTLVTGHEAFGYLATRYRFQQKGIAGFNPNSEPSAKVVADMTSYVKNNNVSTVYTEVLAPPEVAQTVSKGAGVKLAVLDPIEGLSDQSAAQDYPALMRANLATLRAGQECS